MGVSSSSKETNPKKESKRGKITSQPFQGLTKTILRLLESGHLTETERERSQRRLGRNFSFSSTAAASKLLVSEVGGYPARSSKQD